MKTATKARSLARGFSIISSLQKRGTAVHIPDLSPCCYFPIAVADKMVAVGWLEPGQDYRQGNIEPNFVRKLVDLLVEPWQPHAAAGVHACGFCRLSGGPGSFRLANMLAHSEVRMGVANLFVPAQGFLYVAPSLVLHYMDAHGYSPLGEFQDAVMACPPMRSMQYLKAILKNGPKGLVATAR